MYLFDDVMIDWETYGTNACEAAVRSLAIVPFRKSGYISRDCFKGYPSPHFYSNITEAEQLSLGRIKEPDTVEWWSKQSPKSQMILQHLQNPIGAVLTAAVQFIHAVTESSPTMWACDMDFDGVIWKTLFDQLGLVNPIKFSGTGSVRTARTCLKYAGQRIPSRTLKMDETGFIKHYALHDCYAQIMDVQAMFGLIQPQNQAPSKR